MFSTQCQFRVTNADLSSLFAFQMWICGPLTEDPSSAEEAAHRSSNICNELQCRGGVGAAWRLDGWDWLFPACVPRGGSLKSRSPVKYEIPERRSVGRTLVSLNIPGCLGNIMVSIYN